MFSNVVCFSVNVDAQYLTLKIFYIEFPIEKLMCKHCSHNHEQLGD